MSCNNASKTKFTPPYYHREYENDFSKNGSLYSRIAVATLPFISLYQPIGKPLTLVLSSLRIVNQALSLQNSKNIPSKALPLALSVGALACEILAHPMGMVITTAQDTGLNTLDFVNALRASDYKTATEKGAQALNNALYLNLFLVGGFQAAALSFSTQIALGFYKSHQEYTEGRYLEAASQFGMVAVRSHQLKSQHEIFQSQNALFETIQALTDANLPLPVHNLQLGLPEFHTAVVQGDLEKVKSLVEKGYDINQPSRMGTPLEVALNQQFLPIAQYLLQEGAIITQKAMTECCYNGYVEGLELLCSYGGRLPAKLESTLLIECLIMELVAISFILNRIATMTITIKNKKRG